MRLFGFEITRAEKQYSAVLPYNYGPNGYGTGAWPTVHEPFTFAWQRNMELRGETVLGYPAVYACVTRISSDISKLPLLLMQKETSGVWTETESPAFSPVLREPNHYQTTAQFIEQWLFSKLIQGNAYIFKRRDQRGIVVELHVLDPRTTRPAVADNGEIYYKCGRDNLAGLAEDTTLSASEVIHDRMNPMYHTLCGVTPLTAAGMAALQGLAIQRQSTGFFQNAARPGGILSAPGRISDEAAARLKQYFENEFGGGNAGKIAVAGDGLQYMPLTMTAVDAEVIEQLKMTATHVCACYQVPPFMVGFGETPKYDNIEAQIRLYFSQCLQSLTLGIEGLLDRGLNLNQAKDGVRYGTYLDLDVLFDMDTSTLMKTLTEGVKGVMTSNEARKRLNLPPAEGGDQVMTQQQNYSLPALARRDAKEDPFATGGTEAGTVSEDDDEDIEAQAQLAAWSYAAHMERLAA